MASMETPVSYTVIKMQSGYFVGYELSLGSLHAKVGHLGAVTSCVRQTNEQTLRKFAYR